MPKYEVEFLDGSKQTIDADNGTIAKQRAKHTARQQTGVEQRTDPRLKVKAVTDLDQQAAEREREQQQRERASSQQGGR